MNRLEFDSIEVSFGQMSLLKSVYMMCETGKVTGLLGRNGSGKSTLMKVVFGAIPATHKSIRIDNRPLGPDYVSKGIIAYLPQGNLIPEYITIGKAFSLFGIDEREISDLLPEANDMMDLRPAALSGGYRRIFEVFLILKSKAIFCLLDEPFTGLTPVYIQKINMLILTMKQVKGIIISDHMYRYVIDLADNLYLLANGQTYPVDSEEDLISRGYLGANQSRG